MSESGVAAKMQAGKLYVVGAGGHGRVVAATALAAGFELGGFLDDIHAGSAVMGVPVIGPVSMLAELGGVQAIVAVGENRDRAALVLRFPHARWTTVVHPTAWVDRSAVVAAGVAIMARVVVQPGACIGEHVILNTGAIVEHDCHVGKFAHLATGALLGGAVVVGEGVLLGTGATVRPKAVVGEWATVGAGGVVIADVPARVVAVGCPARPKAGSLPG